jgi:hypothetical protein
MAEFIASYIAISVVLYLTVRVGDKDGRRKHDQVTLTSAELQRTDKGTFGSSHSRRPEATTPSCPADLIPLHPEAVS